MLEEKQLLLDEVKENLTQETGFIVLNYKKLAPNEVANFRQELYDSGSRLFVTKKRLFDKASQDAGCACELKEFEGHLAIVSCTSDFVKTTKALCKFQKDVGDNIEILGGYFESKECSPEQVKEISSLPSEKEMKAMLLGLFEAPMSQTLAVFEALLTSVPHCLENKVQKENS